MCLNLNVSIFVLFEDRCYANMGFIKVVKRRATRFDNLAKKWKGPLGLVPCPRHGVWHLQTADCRPQIADCKLKDTKNLPNKGDTIKNINRVKVRKQPGNRDIFLHWPHCQDAVGYSFYWLTRHITNCNDFLFFFDYCELIMTSSNSH